MRFSACISAPAASRRCRVPETRRESGSRQRRLRGLLVVLFPLFQVLASPRDASAFDFKREIFGAVPTLSVIVEEVNGETGYVRVNGADSAGPTIAFTWDWGDGTTSESFFPATHTYGTPTQNCVLKVTSHYADGTSDSVNAVIRFVAPAIAPVSLPDATRVSIPAVPTTLTSRMAGYGIPEDLAPFDDSFFGLLPRSAIEYVLSVAATVQMEFAHGNVFLPDGAFQQVLLRDAASSSMYSLWYTTPVAFGVSDYGFLGAIEYSSFFHEMGHNVTLNSPAGYYYGGKIDGNANAIFSESMAQIFQHATAHFILNHREEYGLPADVVEEVEGSARSSMRLVRSFYDQYLVTTPFASWNDPETPGDETLLTFMTIAYKFFEHAEEGAEGYAEPLKRMMLLLQTFDEGLRLRYDQAHDTTEGDTFRATLMVAALSNGVQEDLREEFRSLNFPIDDQTYADLVASVGTPTRTATPTATPTPCPSEAPRLAVGDAASTDGDFCLDVTLSNPGGGVQSLVATLVGVSDEFELTGATCTARTTGFSCTAGESGDGQIVLSVDGQGGLCITPGTGGIARVCFHDKAPVCPTTSLIRLDAEDVAVSGCTAQPLPVCTESGSIACGLLGDCVNDGAIDIFDILQKIDVILQRTSLTPVEAILCDADCSGSIDIFDVLRGIDALLGRIPQPLTCPAPL
jgi:hypothetical protein